MIIIQLKKKTHPPKREIFERMRIYFYTLNKYIIQVYMDACTASASLLAASLEDILELKCSVITSWIAPF